MTISSGKVRTSVVLSLRRNLRLRLRMVASSTMAMDSSCEDRLKPVRTYAARRTRCAKAAISRRLRRGTVPLTSTFTLALFVRAVVRGDDLGHHRVAHHVAVAEVEELDAFDALEDPAHFAQPRLAPLGQVDLRHVAGDHRARAEP